VSHKLEIELANGHRYEYNYPSAERRSDTVRFVKNTWKSQKTGALALTDPTGATVTLNTSHIVRMVEP
jgi:hypothetical protein